MKTECSETKWAAAFFVWEMRDGGALIKSLIHETVGRGTLKGVAIKDLKKLDQSGSKM